ncbi:unnamed protein product [Vicia faba]|uniref:Uncharacterized protein n=1 Tax=Vicia faba TaxID=3906 RepID=A0AAV0ZXU9_VICFA|nr:unnamed protein product [Vicia faba]
MIVKKQKRGYEELHENINNDAEAQTLKSHRTVDPFSLISLSLSLSFDILPQFFNPIPLSRLLLLLQSYIVVSLYITGSDIKQSESVSWSSRDGGENKERSCLRYPRKFWFKQTTVASLGDILVLERARIMVIIYC